MELLSYNVLISTQIIQVSFCTNLIRILYLVSLSYALHTSFRQKRYKLYKIYLYLFHMGSINQVNSVYAASSTFRFWQTAEGLNLHLQHPPVSKSQTHISFAISGRHLQLHCLPLLPLTARRDALLKQWPAKDPTCM